MSFHCNYVDKSLHLMDDSEFQSHSYQRVYQYLHRHFAGSNLDEYSFTGKSEGSPQECLKHLLRYIICYYYSYNYGNVHDMYATRNVDNMQLLHGCSE